MQKKQIVLFVGPTCVGKTTLIRTLQEDCFPNSGLLVSYTTRQPRVLMGEKNGVGYFFVTEEEFLAMESRGEFYESVKRPTGYYASSQKQVYTLLEKFPVVFGDMDVEGAKLVKSKEATALTIFLYPDDINDLGVRLRARPDSEPEEKILARINIAQNEMLHQDDFDAKVLNSNGKFNETVEKVLIILKKHGIVQQK